MVYLCILINYIKVLIMEGVFYVWVLIKFIKKGINFVKNIFCNLSIVLVIMKLFIFLGDCFVIFCLDSYG